VARAEYRLDGGGEREREEMGVEGWDGQFSSSSLGGPRTGNSRKQNNGLTGSQLSSTSS
jgi:hypothetical protein